MDKEKGKKDFLRRLYDGKESFEDIYKWHLRQIKIAELKARLEEHSCEEHPIDRITYLHEQLAALEKDGKDG